MTDSHIRRFIEEAGNFTQALGMGRVLGQIYAYLYFSPQPRTLDDLKDGLGISKGSASMVVRQLEQWGALQRVWVKGDRKDYYVANDYFGRILRNMLRDTLGKRVDAMSDVLDQALRASRTNGRARNVSGEAAFLRQRLERLQSFQKKAAGMLQNPLVKMMLR